jgi:hypothetical protein
MAASTGADFKRNRKKAFSKLCHYEGGCRNFRKLGVDGGGCNAFVSVCFCCYFWVRAFAAKQPVLYAVPVRHTPKGLSSSLMDSAFVGICAGQ